jgi:hypothetical protein
MDGTPRGAPEDDDFAEEEENDDAAVLVPVAVEDDDDGGERTDPNNEKVGRGFTTGASDLFLLNCCCLSRFDDDSCSCADLLNVIVAPGNADNNA